MAGCLCDWCIKSSVTCMWPPGEWQACFECMRWHNKCLINSESIMQHMPRGSGPTKKVRVISQPVIEEVNKEAMVEELMGKEMTPEEAFVEAIALEEVPIKYMLPCLEELVWENLQEVHKLHKSSERCEHFEYGLLEEMHKLVTLKGREVALAQGNVTLADVTQGSVMVGRSRVQEKGKRKAREPERVDRN